MPWGDREPFLQSFQVGMVLGDFKRNGNWHETNKVPRESRISMLFQVNHDLNHYKSIELGYFFMFELLFRKVCRDVFHLSQTRRGPGGLLRGRSLRGRGDGAGQRTAVAAVRLQRSWGKMREWTEWRGLGWVWVS